MIDIEQRAFDLYRDLRAQGAVPSSYEDVRSFVSIRQMEAKQYVDAISKRIWERFQT